MALLNACSATATHINLKCRTAIMIVPRIGFCACNVAFEQLVPDAAKWKAR
jgi:hypothetical protein